MGEMYLFNKNVDDSKSESKENEQNSKNTEFDLSKQEFPNEEKLQDFMIQLKKELNSIKSQLTNKKKYLITNNNISSIENRSELEENSNQEKINENQDIIYLDQDNNIIPKAEAEKYLKLEKDNKQKEQEIIYIDQDNNIIPKAEAEKYIHKEQKEEVNDKIILKSGFFNELNNDIKNKFDYGKEFQRNLIKKIDNNDIISSLKEYWAKEKINEQSKESIIDFKEKFKTELVILEELENQWKNIYFEMSKKEQEIIKISEELKYIISEYKFSRDKIFRIKKNNHLFL